MPNPVYQTDAVKLREHLEALLLEQRRYFEVKLDAIVDATVVARVAMNQRLDGMNEFRDALRDQAAMMITRAEFAVANERLRADIDDLKRYKSISEGKASQGSVYFFGLLSIASLIISIIKFLI